MGLFSRLAGSIWNGIKRATTFVYERAIRPAVRAVGRFLGISVERVDRALATVEAVAAKVVGVLETDLAPSSRRGWTRCRCVSSAGPSPTSGRSASCWCK